MTHNEKRQSAVKEGLIGLGGKVDLSKQTAFLTKRHFDWSDRIDHGGGGVLG